MALPPDAPEPDHCGSCRACLDICPTDAFPAPYRLDARRCISYLTIEHEGPIPREFRAAIGNRIYGCDDCLAVCPWNKFAQATREAKLAARDDLDAPPLAELARLDDAGFRARFSGSPIKRIGRDRFVRNVADRDRQFRRCRPRPAARPSAARRRRRRWCAVRRSGRWRGSTGASLRGGTRRAHRRRNEWAAVTSNGRTMTRHLTAPASPNLPASAPAGARSRRAVRRRIRLARSRSAPSPSEPGDQPPRGRRARIDRLWPARRSASIISSSHAGGRPQRRAAGRPKSHRS